MVLEFVEKRRGPADKYQWYPFALDSPTFRQDWWDLLPYNDDDPWYVQVLRDGLEVGRVKFCDRKMWLSEFGVEPEAESKALEVLFIEVASDHRREHLGTQIVRGLEKLRPDRILVAFSEGADEFWKSTGWRRYDHLFEPPGFKRPLFVQQR